MAVTHFKSNMDQDLYLFDIASRSCRLLTEHEGEEINAPVGFTAGGRLLRVTDRGHEFAWLAEQDLETGELKAVRRGEWDVEAAQVSEDGRIAAWAVNEGGLARFEAVNLETGEELAVADLPAGWCLHFALSPDGRHLAAVIGTGTNAFDLYVADLQEGRSRRLTRSYRGAISETSLVPAELVSYPTFDGRRVPAWLYRPPTRGPLPVLLSIHGGPEAQERPGSSTWVPFYQFLCSRGVAVLAPNTRGSSGYGKSYQTLIHRDWGGGELKDIEAAAEYLAAQDWADRERIAVFGGSFGGFATLSAITRLPDLWACGVDLFGPSNLVTFAKAVPPFWREMMRAWVGDPDEDREMLVERSPITYVDQVRAPLLVIQGATDPRVVKAESDQMVDRLRSLGRDVDYLVFDDEGHGFTRTANQLKAFRHVVDFLAKHLQFAA
jgi:dipeptidyl aminopeptidase/acylaminoacyl peptidase